MRLLKLQNQECPQMQLARQLVTSSRKLATPHFLFIEQVTVRGSKGMSHVIKGDPKILSDLSREVHRVES